MLRLCYPRDPDPSVAIVDSQSVKPTVVGGVAGYDAGKQVDGRKRHSSVDTLACCSWWWLLPPPYRTPVAHRSQSRACVADCHGSSSSSPMQGTSSSLSTGGRVRRAGCRSGAARRAPAWVSCVAEARIVECTLDPKGTPVNPYRRLSKDYEYYPSSSEAMIYLASLRLMPRRVTRCSTSSD